MILYWFLLLLTAAIAYGIGSLDTMVLSSNFVFRRSLLKLGKGNVWLSNFRRIYGVPGFIKLFLVELVRDVLPILIGALLLGFKGHADVGRAFAGFCLAGSTPYIMNFAAVTPRSVSRRRPSSSTPLSALPSLWWRSW